ncbi:hypothetical protein WJX73_001475 [Symbiochloris irregularis]|uniref:Uncharacterized protein n=1 Tax=Symbiochloris irregularis TaxID=706552 RepID=A0AAW1NZF6_9CHLO
MLPSLRGCDLAALACTCTGGQYLVSLASHKTWQNVAAEFLPSRHPVLQSTQVSAIRAALAAFSCSKTNLLNGTVACCKEVPRAMDTPKFAPTGEDSAVMVAPHSDPHASESDSDFDWDTDEWPPYALLPGDQCTFCLMAFLRGLGTARLCMWR